MPSLGDEVLGSLGRFGSSFLHLLSDGKAELYDLLRHWTQLLAERRPEGHANREICAAWKDHLNQLLYHHDFPQTRNIWAGVLNGIVPARALSLGGPVVSVNALFTGR